MVALARERAAVADAQQIGVVDVGQGLGRPGLVARDPHGVDLLRQAKLTRQRSQHRQIDARCRRRRRPSAAAAGKREMTAVGGDHIRVKVADPRRAAELRCEPVAERAEDRRVLPAGARRRGARRDPLGLGEQVALLKLGAVGRRGRGADRRGDGGLGELAVDELELRVRLVEAGELELALGHRRRLSLKARMSGHVKPALGR
ncbi:MAG: hypothetical protein ABSG43_30895 [Solirubrobacteraceae bacterium]